MTQDIEYREPSQAEIEAADAWIDEHYGPGSVPMRVVIRGPIPEGLVVALPAAMAQRRDCGSSLRRMH